ncbi:sugar phosphate isomerase/epimerase family protein [Microbacterium sp. B2969]|uniref:Sugar phosphate isomerase/epimerase family protein n=1 Tax=Microbacterium alkaliflavum TaxID=3248839 RepID=A0ABW7Q8Y7_9MICO
MRIGVDSTKFPGARDLTAIGLLERVDELGFEGVYFRSVLELSPALDAAELRDVQDCARDLDLRIEAGIGKVNPFTVPELPDLRALGGGDYRRAMHLLIEAAAECGVHELWSALCNYQFSLRGLDAFDRFRTDVQWSEQLTATVRFLKTLAPVLRAHGTHVNLETHEEITSFELVRIVEEVGQDVVGITFDTANVLVRGESAVAAARRVAPYVRATHVRDAALVHAEDGLTRILRPVGEGVIDWPGVLEAIAAAEPMLSIEGIISSRAAMPIPFFDERWESGHPDQVADEREELFRLADDYEERARQGLVPDAAALSGPVSSGEPLEFLLRSARALRSHLTETVTQSVTAPLSEPAGLAALSSKENE